MSSSRACRGRTGPGRAKRLGYVFETPRAPRAPGFLAPRIAPDSPMWLTFRRSSTCPRGQSADPAPGSLERGWPLQLRPCVEMGGGWGMWEVWGLFCGCCSVALIYRQDSPARSPTVPAPSPGSRCAAPSPGAARHPLPLAGEGSPDCDASANRPPHPALLFPLCPSRTHARLVQPLSAPPSPVSARGNNRHRSNRPLSRSRERAGVRGTSCHANLRQEHRVPTAHLAQRRVSAYLSGGPYHRGAANDVLRAG